MNISRYRLEQALQQVQQGRMQPRDAALWLMQTDPSAETADACRSEPVQIAGASTEGAPPSVAELQATLGPPPLEIQNDWNEQLAVLAAQFQSEYGRALPDLCTLDLLVDGDNRLSLSPAFLAAMLSRFASPQRTADHSSAPGSGQPGVVADPSLHVVAQPMKSRQKLTGDTTRRRHRDRYSRKRSFVAKHPWSIPAGLILVAAIAVVLNVHRRPPDELAPVERTPIDPSTRSGTATPKPRGNETSIFSPQAIPLTQPRGGADAPPPMKDSNATLGLLSFAGDNWISANELPHAIKLDARQNTPSLDAPHPSEQPVGDQATSLSDDMAVSNLLDVEDRAPHQHGTQTRSAASFALPAIPAVGDTVEPTPSVTVIEQPVQNLELRFPVETSLSLVQNGQQWFVQDVNEAAALGTFTASDGDLQFQWSDLAASRPLARHLLTGALTYAASDGSRRFLFLRPEVTAEPLSIDLSDADSTSTWPITSPVPTGPSSLTLQFHLPQGIHQSWIQPPDPKQFRRSQSVAEFTLDKDSTVAIRCRLDLRTGTRISLRMRHTAQWDPAFAWQLISTATLQSASHQVTDQLSRALSEQARLKTAYSRASSAEKHLLGSQRDAVDAHVVQMQTLRARVNQYEQLVSQLQEAAFLTMRLEVAWPDTTPISPQRIFTMSMPGADHP